jgi:hypothetical protein
MSTNRHPPGYLSDNERALTPKSFRLPRETVEELEIIAALTGQSLRETVKQAIAELGQKVRGGKSRASRRS